MSASTQHAGHLAHGGKRHERHRPEETVLYQVFAEHWQEFVERSEQAAGLPRFVITEVEEYLRCGMLEHGLLRCQCQHCGHEKVCAFSCKRRGFCPSCLGRRMTDTALNLVEQVLPEGVPVRQWVCSLPWRLRVVCGYDSALCADVIGAFVREVSRSLKHRAKRELGLPSVADAHTGSVLFIQRFDSALRLNVHMHLLALDGVYVRAGQQGDDPLVFHELRKPSAAEMADVAQRTAARLVKVLREHGRELDPELGVVDVASDTEGDESSALSACYAAAAAGTDLFGERAGSPALRLVDPSAARPDEPVAIVSGVNVHAKVRVHGNDRAQLERLCRYLGRPPIANERLTRMLDGRLRYELKRVWKDGTRAVVFEPLDLIARVVAMIPAPRVNMIRYYGCLSSHSSLRREVVPQATARVVNQLLEDEPAEQLHFGFGETDAGDTLVVQRSTKRRPWAWLLRHVWQMDVSTCELCGTAMNWVEVATEPQAIARVLREFDHEHRHAQHDGHRTAATRRPPPEQLRFGFG